MICPICNEFFSSVEKCQNHIRSVHEGQKDFKCDKKYSDRKKFKSHNSAVHENSENSNSKLKRHPCDECGKYFQTSTYLKNHIATVHEGRKDHKCEHCDKAFAQPNGLQYHVSTVHEKTNFCDVCEKAFQTPQLLQG